MSRADPRSRKPHGGFAALLKNSCHAATDPVVVIGGFANLLSMNPNRLTLFNLLRGSIPFILTGYYLDRRNLLKARRWSDRYLGRSERPYYAIGLATDGLLMILENRHSDAKQRFAESLMAPRDISTDHDDEYVRGYSQLWLSIIASAEDNAAFDRLGGSAGLAAMRDVLASGPAGDWLKRRLRLPDRCKLDLWKESQDTDVPKFSAAEALVQKSEIQFSF